MGCTLCKDYLSEIKALQKANRDLRKTRRELSTTIRLLKSELTRQMENEHAAESAVSQADGFAEDQSNVD